MNFIIIYNECLRSKIIYYDFIERNKDKIKYIIRVPNLTRKKNGKFSFFLIKKFIATPFYHKTYIFIIVSLYLFLNKLFKSDIKSLAKKLYINYQELDYLPNKYYLKKLFRNKEKDNIVMCSTSHILTGKIFSNKYKILNIHEGDLPIYAGSATYYYNVLNNESYYRSTLMMPNLTIDAGTILKKSEKINVKNKSVFEVLLIGLITSSKLITYKFPKNIRGVNLNKFRKNFYSYTFPTKKNIRDIKKRNKKIFFFKDYLFLIKLILIKSNNKLYNIIKKRVF